MESVSLLAALVSGFLSFISPGVLPLIPGYLAFISLATLGEPHGKDAALEADIASPPSDDWRSLFVAWPRAIVSAGFFVLGFSLVFVPLGAPPTALGSFLIQSKPLLSKIGGAVLVAYGLRAMGLLNIGLLLNEKRVQLQAGLTQALGALLVGLVFALGWTPGTGPMLSAILAIAATPETVMRGVRLLVAYSLGLAIPFVLTALAVNQLFEAFARTRRHDRAIAIASGAVFILFGVMLFTNSVAVIARCLSPYLPAF